MLVFLWQLQMSFQKLKLWSRLWLWIYSGHFDQFGQIEISKGDRFLFQIWEVDEERQFPRLIFWKRCFLEGSRDRGRRENKGLAPKRLKSLTIGRLGHWLLYFVLSLYFNWLDSFEAPYARVRQNRFAPSTFSVLTSVTWDYFTMQDYEVWLLDKTDKYDLSIFSLKYWLQCEGRSGCRCERMGPMLHCYTSPEQPSPILQNFDNSKEGQQQEKRQSHQNLNNFNKYSWNEWLNFIINLQSSSNICNQVWQDRRYQYYFISPAVRIRGSEKMRRVESSVIWGVPWKTWARNITSNWKLLIGGRLYNFLFKLSFNFFPFVNNNKRSLKVWNVVGIFKSNLQHKIQAGPAEKCDWND